MLLTNRHYKADAIRRGDDSIDRFEPRTQEISGITDSAAGREYAGCCRVAPIPGQSPEFVMSKIINRASGHSGPREASEPEEINGLSNGCSIFEVA